MDPVDCSESWVLTGVGSLTRDRGGPCPSIHSYLEFLPAAFHNFWSTDGARPLVALSLFHVFDAIVIGVVYFNF